MQVTGGNGNSRQAVTVDLARIAIEIDLLTCKVTTSSPSFITDPTTEAAWAHYLGACTDLGHALADKFVEHQREESAEVIQIRRWSESRAA